MTKEATRESWWSRWTLSGAAERARTRNEQRRVAVLTAWNRSSQRLRAARTLWYAGHTAESLGLAGKAFEAAKMAATAAGREPPNEPPPVPIASSNAELHRTHLVHLRALFRATDRVLQDTRDETRTLGDVRRAQLRHGVQFLLLLLIVAVGATLGLSQWLTNRDAPWMARYYPEPNFEGDPEWRRDEVIHFNWGLDEAVFGLPADRFSVRWDTCVDVSEAVPLAVIATYDDGVRIRVDGQTIAESWTSSGPPTLRGSARLERGAHHIRVEYHENLGHARVDVDLRVDGDPALLRRPARPDGGCGELALSRPMGVVTHDAGTSPRMRSRAKVPTPRIGRAADAGPAAQD